jgi:hypothetical protein
VNTFAIVNAPSPRRFQLPPVHLFWGASDEKQRTYYYHFLVLREQFSLRAQGRLGDLPGLTTDEWRSALGEAYWKSMWPRPNPSDVGSSNFDPLRFWIHGGPLFFGEELSAEVVSGHDPTSRLPCGCDVQMDTADDDEIRQVVLYHLNMNHMSAEIKEMDLLQFSLFSHKDKLLVNQCRDSPIYAMADIWGPYSGGGVQPHFFANKTCWWEWLDAVHRVTMEWEGFDTWDWKGLKDVRNIVFHTLHKDTFHKLTTRMLTFFITTFITCLGYFPSPMLLPPTLATHNCSKHRKSFAAGH